MRRIPTSSSALRSVGYDPTRRLLEAEFAHGGTYRYFDVPPGLYHALLRAPSKGRFFQARIRGRFAYEEVLVPAQRKAPA